MQHIRIKFVALGHFDALHDDVATGETTRELETLWSNAVVPFALAADMAARLDAVPLAPHDERASEALYVASPELDAQIDALASQGIIAEAKS